MDIESPFIGQIVPTAASYPPLDWALCNGQKYQVAQYQALYSLIGNTFGGTSMSTFGVPNMQGCITCGSGGGYPNIPSVAGQQEGTDSLILNNANLPNHGHGVALALNTGVDYLTGNGTQKVPPAVGLLANAVVGTTTVDVYAPFSATSPVTAVLATTVTGTPQITAGVAGGYPNGATAPISLIQPTSGMLLCICMVGIYPVNE